MNLNITPEVIAALKWLRTGWDGDNSEQAIIYFNILDDSGVYAEIDEATGYDVNPEQRVSKCNCSKTVPQVEAGNHFPNCPGDPAEWGDLAFESKVIR